MIPSRKAARSLPFPSLTRYLCYQTVPLAVPASGSATRRPNAYRMRMHIDTVLHPVESLTIPWVFRTWTPLTLSIWLKPNQSRAKFQLVNAGQGSKKETQQASTPVVPYHPDLMLGRLQLGQGEPCKLLRESCSRSQPRPQKEHEINGNSNNIYVQQPIPHR